MEISEPAAGDVLVLPGAAVGDATRSLGAIPAARPIAEIPRKSRRVGVLCHRTLLWCLLKTDLRELQGLKPQVFVRPDVVPKQAAEKRTYCHSEGEFGPRSLLFSQCFHEKQIPRYARDDTRLLSANCKAATHKPSIFSTRCTTKFQSFCALALTTSESRSGLRRASCARE